jgi:hypothetical protein
LQIDGIFLGFCAASYAHFATIVQITGAQLMDKLGSHTPTAIRVSAIHLPGSGETFVEAR